MTESNAIAWHMGRKDGSDIAREWLLREKPSEALRAYINEHPDAALPWTNEQAHLAGFCVGLSEVLSNHTATVGAPNE